MDVHDDSGWKMKFLNYFPYQEKNRAKYCAISFFNTVK